MPTPTRSDEIRYNKIRTYTLTRSNDIQYFAYLAAWSGNRELMATNTCWYLCILGWALRGRSEVCAAVVQAEYGTAQSLTAVYSYSTEGSERGEYCTAAVARLDLVSREARI